jgi:NAD-dependent dihydropyrimidine dehydrogenase PreA subunit
MTHIITSLCLRDGACVDVCPVECIVPGKPESEWPWYFIDPDTCIDCGACVPECPFEAIFIEEEVPAQYTMAKDQKRIPFDTKVEMTAVGGEVVDLTLDIQPNYDYFKSGTGYDALSMD